MVLTGAASRATAAATDGFDQTGIKREGSRFSAPNPTVTRRGLFRLVLKKGTEPKIVGCVVSHANRIVM